MGDLIQVGATEWCAWTGGKPKHDWSALDASAPTDLKDPNQMRPASPGSAQKSSMYREVGLEQKFSRNANFQDFITTTSEYFVRYGLDTIAYLPNPANGSEMLLVIEAYARFDYDAAVEAAALLTKKFDKFDEANSKSASRWLLNSLDEDLKHNISKRLKIEDGFVAHWFELVREIQSVSFDRFENLKQDIRKLRLTQFPQQNVKLLSNAYLQLAKQLEDNSMYEHPLTLTMVTQFLSGGGSTDPNDRNQSVAKETRCHLV